MLKCSFGFIVRLAKLLARAKTEINCGSRTILCCEHCGLRWRERERAIEWEHGGAQVANGICCSGSYIIALLLFLFLMLMLITMNYIILRRNPMKWSNE